MQGNILDNWELKSNFGLGNIEFGISKEQVEIHKDTLGKITLLTRQKDQQNSLLDTYELMKDFFSEEDLKNAMDAIAEVNEEIGSLEIENWDSGISISYENEVLTEFFADDRAKHLHFKNISVFSADPLLLVKNMIDSLSEIPVIKNNELVFRNNYIFLFDFIDEKGKPIIKGEKSITWRNSPRHLGVSLEDYKIFKI